MRYLGKRIYQERGNIFSVLSTTALSTAVSFCMMLAFANLISSEELGTYQYIISIVSIIGAFSLTGIHTSIIRAIGKKQFSFLSTAKRFIYLGSLPALGVAVSISLYYGIAGNLLLASSILICTILYTAWQINSRFNTIFIALDDIKKANYLTKFYAIAPALVVLPALFFTQQPHILAILYFLSTFLFFSVAAHIFKAPDLERSLMHSSEDSNKNLERNHSYLKFGFHQSIFTLINTVAAHSDKIILFQILGPQQTAIYFIATSIPNRIRIVAKDFSPWIFSRFAQHSAEAVKEKMLKRLFGMLILIIPIYILYVVFAPFLFNLLLPQYTDAIWLSQLYALTFFVSAIVIPHSALKAYGEAKDFYKISVAYSIIRPLLIASGALLYGLTGVILACIIDLLGHLLLVTILAKNIKSDN